MSNNSSTDLIIPEIPTENIVSKVASYKPSFV